MFASSLVILFAASVAALAAGNPAFPTRYHVKGTIALPSGLILEPYEAWVDLEKGNSRIDYYGGMAKIINLQGQGSFGTVFKVVPQPGVSEHCFKLEGEEGGKVMPQPVLPDITNYTYIGQGPIPNTNLTADMYFFFYSMTKGAKNNTYILYIDSASKLPIVFYFKGYDKLFGSHYDMYYFTYQFMSASFDDSVFDYYSKFNCTGFPGPGLTHSMHANPMFEMVGTPHHTEEDKVSQFHSEFEDFKMKHGKEYKDDREHFERKNTFRNNYRMINSHNRKGLSYTLAVNHLADLNGEERRIIAGYRYSAEERAAFPSMPYTPSGNAIPDSMDWRLYGAVSRVKDQGICGSCWSFGTVGTLEGSHFLKHNLLVEFSEQALMDCSWKYGNNGCDGGEDFRSYQYIMDNGCLPREDRYGQYLMQDGMCHAKQAGCGVSISNFTLVTPGDENALLDAIATFGPISVAIDASLETFGFYANGVYYDENCKSGVDDLDHAVLAVGYGTLGNDDYWLVKNSWSTNWGNEGYILMSRKNNNCGVATAPSFATVK